MDRCWSVAPAANEVVGVSCVTGDAAIGTVSPSQLTFTAATYNIPADLTLRGVPDGVNGGGDRQFVVTCTAVASASVPGGVFRQPTVFPLAAVTLDVFIPYFDDVLIQRSGRWETSLVSGQFLPVTQGDEVVRLIAGSR
jgi:hypothetical protein